MAAKKGFFVLFGSPGSGKSTEAAACFQNSLYVKSSPNVTQFYDEWLKGPIGQSSGLGLPRREVTLDMFYIEDSWQRQDGQITAPQIQFDPSTGLPVPVPQAPTLIALTQQVMAKALQERAHGQPLTYSNYVIDEGGTLLSRVFQEILPQCVNKAGNVDTREAYNLTAKWALEWSNLLRQVLITGMNVCLVAHDTEPDPGSGKKGGPKFVSKAIVGQICADADGVLLRALEDRDFGQPAARIWKAHASQNWMSKLRGLPDSEFHRIKDMALADILSLAGYAPY